MINRLNRQAILFIPDRCADMQPGDLFSCQTLPETGLEQVGVLLHRAKDRLRRSLGARP